MKRLATMVAMVVVAGCSSNPPATTVASPFLAAATEFAVTADRALDGTRFEESPVGDIAAALVAVCESSEALPVAIPEAIAAVGAPAEPAGDGVIVEVLAVGVSLVCPQRAVTELSAAYLAAVAVAVQQGGAPRLDDDVALTAGLSVCSTLGMGTPEDAIVVAAAGLFAIEATASELLGGGLTADHAVALGAVLGSAVTYLCPGFRDVVQAYFEDLLAPPG